MKKIILVNMPFAPIQMPSLGLTQIKYILNRQCKDRFRTDILYLNHDFARYLKNDMIYLYVLSVDGLISGLGDWFFRGLAFPDLPDNKEVYLKRYFPQPDMNTRMLLFHLMEKHKGLDCFFERLIDEYSLAEAEIVGFSSLFFQHTASIAMARKLKKRRPDITIVMGGPACEGCMGNEIVKNVDCIDFVFSGHALISFPRFVRYYDEGRWDLCHQINGVFSKKNQLRSQIGTPGPAANSESPGPLLLVEEVAEELDIDTPIELEYDDFLGSFKTQCSYSQLKPLILFDTSRGCWWGERCQCTFCGLNSTNLQYRVMSPGNFIKRIQSLYRYAPGVEMLKCIDNVIPRFFITDVLPHLQIPEKVSLFFEIKANLKDTEVKALADHHINYIQAGLESLATSTLKLMRKGTTAFQNIMLLRNARKYHVRVGWNLLVGFPGEEEEVYKKYLEDIPLFMHLEPPIVLSPVRFDRYSYYFNHPEQYGLDLRPYDFYELVYPFETGSLQKMAYYFIDYQGNADYVVKLSRWYDRISQQWKSWTRRWQSKTKPELCIRENQDGVEVYDTRWEQPRRHRLTEPEISILRALDTPNTIAGIAHELPLYPEAQVEKIMESLTGKKLLFREQDRYLNLVLPEKT